MKLCPTCRTKYPDDANFCPQEGCATPDGPQRLQPIAEEVKARFQPLTRIGGSSTGEVWKARDTQTGADVALKVVSPEVLPTAAAQSRAERELKQLMRVGSPKIATVIDCSRAPDGRLIVAMELCEGEPLERLLKGGPMPFDRARTIVGQIGQALLEAQKAGVVHRDVSPKNVLISAAGEVKVINFAVPKPLSEKVAGVPAYVSPEQAQGKPVDQRSNTYSLACIFYHLLTGEPPFQAATPQAVLDLHISSPALPPSQRRPEANLTPDIDRVILKALDKSSSRRHLTLRLFLTEVEGLSPPAAPGQPATVGAAGREVGFAKTMLFAGGQAEVASLVAKAIAARTGGTPTTGSPVVRAGQMAAAAARAPAPAAAAVANTVLAAAPEPEPAAQPAPRAPTVAPVPAPAAAPAPAVAPAPVAASAPAQAAKSEKPADGNKGAAFRETLWFKKGDVDQMVADAKARMGVDVKPVEAPVEDVRPLEDRYVDDGSVTTDDRKKFSLRTGGTGTAIPTVGASVPGEGMSEKEVIDEIAGTRRTMILVIAGVALAALLVVLLMMMRGKSPPPPTPAPHAAADPAAAPAEPVAKPPETRPPTGEGTPPPSAVAKSDDPPPAHETRAKKKSAHRRVHHHPH